ncbi:hypothetical protein QWZ14_06735 [Paeniroseomonas aquatica]|uniref:Uncharacterized protein n=1 Tax=Paeniroseomonas aquatica TaxID=373043 RepID=A0ABT8A3G2_9PROT|nr:hypothetical protein [Paeniroseomonas aquatica]MDN3564073.1 hypothetical protein [Paeniroseomonas aquatica]
MMERNVTMDARQPAPGPVLRPAGGSPLPLTTPLVWAWGGVLLTASTWLVGVIALVRSVGGLFD